MREFEPLTKRTNDVGREVYQAAMAVHIALGPGLLESVYKACLLEELHQRRLSFRREVGIPLIYRDLILPRGYRLDILVEELVVVEAKAVELLHPVHEAQLLTYLKLSGYRLGFLMNFNVVLMKDGIRRFVV